MLFPYICFIWCRGEAYKELQMAETDVARLDKMCPVCGTLTNTTGNLGTWLQATRTLLAELATDHATQKTFNDAVETLVEELHDDHATFKTAIDETKTAVDELIDDHATFKTVVDELTAWAEALATKLNADTGVADTDYDATITADAPATLTATKPTAGPATLTATKPSSGPATLTASAPASLA